MKTGFQFLVAVLVVMTGSGCWAPIPHLTTKTMAVRGVVLDAETREPVRDAHVNFTGLPAPVAKVDRQGAFHLSETKNLHLAIKLGMCGDSWPRGSNHFTSLHVEAKDYQPVDLDIGKHVTDPHKNYKAYGNCWQLQDILLTRTP